MPATDPELTARPAAWRARPVLLAIIVLAALLRIHHLGALELWHDEANSLFEAKGLSYVGNAPVPGFTKAELPAFNTLPNVIRACVFIDSGNAPLYVVLLHYWSMLLGDTPFALRALSVLFALVAVVLVHRFSRELFKDERGASFAAAVMALSPLLIGQAQQVRSYTLAVLLSLWATMLLFRLLRSERPNAWTIVLYGLVAVASMLSHYSTCYILLAHPVVSLILRAPLRRVLHVAGGGVLAIALFMTWMVLAGNEGLEQMRVYNQDYVDQLKADPDLVSFFSATRPATVVEGWIVQLLGSTGNGLRFIGPQLRVIALMLIIPIALVGIILLRSKSGPDRRVLLALCVLWSASMIYATVLALISGHTISFQAHYAAFSAPYAAILLGAAIARFRSLPVRLSRVTGALIVAYALIIAVSLTAVPPGDSCAPNDYARHRERLRMALDRYGADKTVALHSSRSAAYQLALFAGPEADDLPNYVASSYPEISGLLVERGTQRWMLTVRPRLSQFGRSVPMDDHVWHLDYGPAPALPDSVDAWQPVATERSALRGNE